MFTGFRQFCEVSFGWYGAMTPFLGGNRWEHLNYGGSEQFGLDQPMLYVPINVAASTGGGSKSPVGKLLAKLRRRASKFRVICHRDESIFSKYVCKPTTDTLDHKGKYVNIARFVPTGESHVTVAIYNQLVREVFSKHFGRRTTREEEIEFLRNTHIDGVPLFNEEGVGIEMPITIKEPAEIIFGVSNFIDGNPIVAIVGAECHGMDRVKKALGLSGPSGYKTHLTVGFADAIWDLPSPDKKVEAPENIGASARSGPGGILKKIHNTSYLRQNPDLPEGFIELGRVVLWD